MRAIQIPDPVEEILNTLEAAGHRAWGAASGTACWAGLPGTGT